MFKLKKKGNIPWFQLLKCEYPLVSFLLNECEPTILWVGDKMGHLRTSCSQFYRSKPSNASSKDQFQTQFHIFWHEILCRHTDLPSDRRLQAAVTSARDGLASSCTEAQKQGTGSHSQGWGFDSYWEHNASKAKKQKSHVGIEHKKRRVSGPHVHASIHLAHG